MADKQVYITAQHAYHVHDGRCVAVQDVSSGRFYSAHPALERRLTCTFEREGERLFVQRAALPDVGQTLCFEFSVVTSEVREIHSLDSVADPS